MLRHSLLLCLLVACTLSSAGRTYRGTVHNVKELEAVFASYVDSAEVTLAPGDYHLTPKLFFDSLATDFDSATIGVTAGLIIKGRYVSLMAKEPYTVSLYTHSGYGILAYRCENFIIENCIVSGGERNDNPKATDAAIIFIRSRGKILRNLIFENLGDSASLYQAGKGIMGICVREGSFAFIFENQIARNSWNGVGVYDNGEATITGNVIDGVERLTYYGQEAGRGAGVFLTRDARAQIESNIIKRYQQGITLFSNAEATVRSNLIEDVELWGIMAYDSDTGAPLLRAEDNIIYKTGACGIALQAYVNPKKGGTGYIRRNILVKTATNKDFDSPDKLCFNCALAVHGRPDGFIIEENLFYKNRWVYPCTSIKDVNTPQFADALFTNFSAVPLMWYAGFSEFIQSYFVQADK